MTRKPSDEQRKALGSFLASRRARLQPTELGLTAGHRRTPGLRREEVAVLAGVSVSWYTWLEQGRDIQVSADTLGRISDVLRLDRAEAAHLFALSSREPPSFPTDGQLTDGLIKLVQAINPLPAYVRNSRLDILAWNPAIAEIFVDYGTLEPHERNTLRLLFMYPPYRTLIVDWEEMARGMLSTFRAARARAQNQKPFDTLVEELLGASEQFRVWWPELDVRNFDEGTKRIRHPSRGLIDFTFVALSSEGQPELSIVMYIPKSTP